MSKNSKIYVASAIIIAIIAIGTAAYYYQIAMAQAVPSITTTTPSTNSYTIMTGTNPGLGTYLVDAKGMTLYYFTGDTPGTSTSDPVSTLTNTQLQIWPVLYISDINAPAGLSPSDFGSFVRSDGTMQTTYQGWPLYYYFGDNNPGDTNGQGINNVWFVATTNLPTPTTTTVATTTTPITPTTTTIPTTTTTYDMYSGGY